MKTTKDVQKDELKEKVEFDKKLSSAIMLSIDADAAFKLYSHRVISPEDFMNRISDLVLMAQSILANSVNDGSN